MIVEQGHYLHSPRDYYVYNDHGDVVALADAQGTIAASYSYDAFGQLTAFSETFGGNTTWTNPYRYDGRDGVRYDSETGLYWLSVRAYDPTLGRFLSRDPLNCAPLFFSDRPYVYAGNNPLTNIDPTGSQLVACFAGGGSYWFDDPPHSDGWVHFVHGTSIHYAWSAYSVDSSIGGGNLGVGFYVIVDDSWGKIVRQTVGHQENERREGQVCQGPPYEVEGCAPSRVSGVGLLQD